MPHLDLGASSGGSSSTIYTQKKSKNSDGDAQTIVESRKDNLRTVYVARYVRKNAGFLRAIVAWWASWVKSWKMTKAQLKHLRKYYAEIKASGGNRLWVYLILRFIPRLLTLASQYFYTRLIELAEQALSTRVIDARQVLLFAGARWATSAIQTVTTRLTESNDSIVLHRITSAMKRRLMRAYLRLDPATLEINDTAAQKMQSASQFLEEDNVMAIPRAAVGLLNAATSTVAQILFLRRQTKRENAPMVALAILFPVITSWQKSEYSVSWDRITNKTYYHLNNIYDMVTQQAYSRPIAMLGLQDYLLTTYDTLSDRLGDVSNAYVVAQRGTRDQDGIINWRQQLNEHSQTIMYLLWALRVGGTFGKTPAPLKGDSVAKPATTTAAIGIVTMAADTLVSEFFRFSSLTKEIALSLRSIQTFYTLDNITKVLPDAAEPVPYVTQSRVAEDGSVCKGMSIELRDVSFTYPISVSRRRRQGSKVQPKSLDGVSFTVQAREMVALVGYNGSGKSTLVNLLSRLYDPQEGSVHINGKNIKEYSAVELRKHQSVIFQRGDVLPVPVSMFIGMADLPNINDASRIRAAASSAGALEWLEETPDQFEKYVQLMRYSHNSEKYWLSYLKNWAMGEEENGDVWDWDGYATDDEEEGGDSAGEVGQKKLIVEEKVEEKPVAAKEATIVPTKSGPPKTYETYVDLPSSSEPEFDEADMKTINGSGGQIQRLALAQSYMRNADLWILDEASAALDPEAEHAYFNQILALRGKATVLYTTHRWGITSKADKILMMERGKVVEAGSHQELMAIEGGKYAKLYKLQAEGFQKDPEGSEEKKETVEPEKVEVETDGEKCGDSIQEA